MISMEKKLGYKFKDPSLLARALTHPSAASENRQESYQRLEYLGDAVLQLTVSEHVFREFPEMAEGAMSKLRSQIVCADSLFSAGCELGIPDLLILGKGEEMSGGRRKKNIVADAMEAIIGALYVDGGLDEARRFVFASLSGIIDSAQSGNLTYDYKTTLQELSQSWEAGELVYELVRVEGPEHDQTFVSRVILGERKFTSAEGRSRKQSEQNAAENALRELKIHR